MVQASVRDHYQAHSAQEWRRLFKNPFHRLEFDTTVHFLEQHLPPTGRVLDAGGGPGRYTIELAKRGYAMVLFDAVLCLGGPLSHVRGGDERQQAVRELPLLNFHEAGEGLGPDCCLRAWKCAHANIRAGGSDGPRPR